ncbi:hypothetical protein [Micromonospora sp. NPDC005299]|uniref:hypothetical protein n=1 Tax=Micromonospora sp. NPDC005299 TaxID=3364231 RepID=UPI00368D7DA6
MSEPEILPWDRHRREPEKAYGYVALYRDLGRTRTVAKVAEQVHNSRDYLHKLATTWKWVQRAVPPALAISNSPENLRGCWLSPEPGARFSAGGRSETASSAKVNRPASNVIVFSFAPSAHRSRRSPSPSCQG